MSSHRIGAAAAIILSQNLNCKDFLERQRGRKRQRVRKIKRDRQTERKRKKERE
jgi:hypothetical protein